MAIVMPRSPESAARVVAEHLAQPATGWSVGMVGAVAEFMRARDESLESSAAGCVVTARGALRIDAPLATRVVRFATGSGLACIALCLPQADARMNARAVLTEVGRDDGALRAADREAYLFDLGVASPYFDFCVRTAEPAAVHRLRACAGASLFSADRHLIAEIAAMQPQRVVCSRLARIEVFQSIAAAGGVTPDGPHTHLLPALLVQQLAFSAEEPIPAGWIPCAHLYLGQLPGHDTDDAAHARH